MTILIDIDSTISNFGEALLNYLEDAFCKTIKNNFGRIPARRTYDEITCYSWFDKTYDNPWWPTYYTEFWNEVKINPDAVKVIDSWVEQGHEVYLVSASRFTDTLGYKIQRTLAPFKNLSEANVIITQNKAMIKGDILIDDCVDNLRHFEGTTVCYAQPWNTAYESNEDFDSLGYNRRRYDNWADIDKYVQEHYEFYEKYWLEYNKN